MVRALMSAVLGLLIAMIGIDPVQGAPRFTFGDNRSCSTGSNIVPVVMGLFGISEILLNVENRRPARSSTRG